MAAAGWYEDPRGAAELRWFDGEGWTDHVSTGGRAYTSPVVGEDVDEPPAAEVAPAGDEPVGDEPPGPGGDGRDVLGLASFVVARPAQSRGHGSWLDVYDETGALGRFVDTVSDELSASAVVRLLDNTGAPVLSVLHPGGSGRARVDGPSGPFGFVSRVGRVRANLELHGPGRKPEGTPLAVLKPLDDKGGWSADGIELRSWPLGTPTAGTYGEARYAVSIAESVPAEVRPLLLALPVLVDRALTQLVAEE